MRKQTVKEKTTKTTKTTNRKPRCPKNWVYVLRTSHKGGVPTYSDTDFRWPEKGYVKAPDWQPTKECGNGLHGWLWGVGNYSNGCLSDKDCVWQVLKVNPDLIIELDNKIKFPECLVEFTGDFHTAFWLIRNEAIKRGVIKNESGYYSPVSSSGYSSPVSSSESFSPVSSSGKYSPVSSSGESSPVSSSGEYSPVSSSGYSSPVSSSGEYSPVSSSGESSPVSSSGEYSPAVCVGLNGKAKSGENGFIGLTWWDEKPSRPRITVGYVGEDIEPHVWYEVTKTGELVKCENQSN